jgi:SAM-dependent methyltransferase
MTADTIDYYATNAQCFAESILAVDMRSLYQHFLPHLPREACILDIGCGSGRDSQYFRQQGHQVVATDASRQIAELAEKEIQQVVRVQRVQDIGYRLEFDGIWASASLLHVAARGLPDVFQRLLRALKPGGCCTARSSMAAGSIGDQGAVLPIWISRVWNTCWTRSVASVLSRCGSASIAGRGGELNSG